MQVDKSESPTESRVHQLTADQLQAILDHIGSDVPPAGMLFDDSAPHSRTRRTDKEAAAAIGTTSRHIQRIKHEVEYTKERIRRLRAIERFGEELFEAVVEDLVEGASLQLLRNVYGLSPCDLHEIRIASAHSSMPREWLNPRGSSTKPTPTEPTKPANAEPSLADAIATPAFQECVSVVNESIARRMGCSMPEANIVRLTLWRWPINTTTGTQHDQR